MRSQTGLNLLLVVASFALRVRQHSLPLCTWQQQVPGSGQITWLKNLVNRVLNLNSLRDSERLAMLLSLQFVPRAQLRARCVNATRSARCRSRWRHPSCLPVHEWCRHWGPQSSPWRAATALRLQCLWACEAVKIEKWWSSVGWIFRVSYQIKTIPSIPSCILVRSCPEDVLICTVHGTH